MTLPNLSQYSRIALVGRPKVGKTTLGEELSRVYKRPLISTDVYMHLPFEEVPKHLVRQLKDDTSYIVEGVQAARCLKYGLEVDLVIWMHTENAVDGKHKGLTSMVINAMTEYSGAVLQVLRIGSKYIVKGERR